MDQLPLGSTKGKNPGPNRRPAAGLRRSPPRFQLLKHHRPGDQRSVRPSVRQLALTGGRTGAAAPPPRTDRRRRHSFNAAHLEIPTTGRVRDPARCRPCSTAALQPSMAVCRSTSPGAPRWGPTGGIAAQASAARAGPCGPSLGRAATLCPRLLAHLY